jgi:hypothetical protein
MERVLLAALGGSGGRNSSRPAIPLSDLDARALTLQINSIEKSTAKNYLTGARDYVSFCIKHNLPLDPTPSTLCRYIAYTSQFISSAPKYLSGARHFLCDIYPQFSTSRSHPLVQATIAGARKIRADPIRRKLPLRPAHLLAFLECAHLSGKYDNFLFATLISCAFYGCHRIGELTWKNDRSLHDWRKVIKRSSLFFEGGRVRYHLPYHKGDRFYTGTDILFSSQTVANPVSLLRQFTSKRDQLHGAKSALFLTEDGSVPSRRWFDSKFFALLDRSFGGHSARAGGATFYASLGLSEDVIQALGRWSSQAWKIYIRDNPTIRAELELARSHPHTSRSR